MASKASLVMPYIGLRDRFVYPYLKLVIDSFSFITLNADA